MMPYTVTVVEELLLPKMLVAVCYLSGLILLKDQE